MRSQFTPLRVVDGESLHGPTVGALAVLAPFFGASARCGVGDERPRCSRRERARLVEDARRRALGTDLGPRGPRDAPRRLAALNTKEHLVDSGEWDTLTATCIPSYIDDERSPLDGSLVKKTKTRACCPPAEPMPPVPKDEDEANEHLARLAKAIAHPVRVAILRMLAHQEGCIVGDIVDELPLAQSTISQHLKQLKDAGLVRGEVDGPRVCYCVEPGAVALFKALVEAL